MDTKKIRRNNLKLLIEKHGSQKALSEASGIDVGYISQMNNDTRSIGEKTARNIERSLKLTDFWMDVDRSESAENSILAEARRKLDLVEPGMLPVVLGAIEAAIKKN